MTHVILAFTIDALALCRVPSILTRAIGYATWPVTGVRLRASLPRLAGQKLQAGICDMPRRILPWLVMLAVGLRKVCHLSICNCQPAACHADEARLSSVRGTDYGR